MNICAARILNESPLGVLTNQDGSLVQMLPMQPRPHEPKSNQRLVLRQLDPDKAGIDRGYVGNYAECQHCGCLYWLED